MTLVSLALYQNLNFNVSSSKSEDTGERWSVHGNIARSRSDEIGSLRVKTRVPVFLFDADLNLTSKLSSIILWMYPNQ